MRRFWSLRVLNKQALNPKARNRQVIPTTATLSSPCAGIGSSGKGGCLGLSIDPHVRVAIRVTLRVIIRITISEEQDLRHQTAKPWRTCSNSEFFSKDLAVLDLLQT